MIGTGVRSARPSLPLGRDDASSLLPFVFAMLVYVATMAGLGALALCGTLRAAEDALATRLTALVPAETSNARLQTVLATLRQTAGIRSAQPLTLAEIAALLEPWLGTPVPIEELPVPRLIDIEIEPGTPVDLAALRQQLAAVVPELRLDDQGSALAGMRGAARPLLGLLAAVIALSLLLVAVLAACATRATLAAARPAVELLNLLGTADRDISRPFVWRGLRTTLIGAGIGVVFVILTVFALADLGAIVKLPARTDVIGLADWRPWAIVAATALLAGLIAAMSALLAARRLLAHLP